MANVLCEHDFSRESGYLYFVNKEGHAARVPMARKGMKTSKKQEVMHKCGITRKNGFLYFIDKKCHTSEAKMARGGKKTTTKKR